MTNPTGPEGAMREGNYKPTEETVRTKLERPHRGGRGALFSSDEVRVLLASLADARLEATTGCDEDCSQLDRVRELEAKLAQAEQEIELLKADVLDGDKVLEQAEWALVERDRMTEEAIAYWRQRWDQAEQRGRALEKVLREVWDSVPSTYDENDLLNQRHARALNVIPAALAKRAEETR